MLLLSLRYCYEKCSASHYCDINGLPRFYWTRADLSNFRYAAITIILRRFLDSNVWLPAVADLGGRELTLNSHRGGLS